MRKIITPDLGIELTQKCNLNCSHCFRGAARNRNISKEIIEKVFDEIKYIQTLDLSGGEVFLGYEQLKTLLETANQKGTTIESCSMLTNGTIYDGRIYELLDEYFGKNYQVGISDDDFHDKSIKRINRENLEDSENPDLHPKSIKDVKNNMYRHFINEHCIGFQRVSKHLINNGRAVNTKTPHKDFEAMGYIKRMSMDTFKSQNRGGKGIKGMQTLEEDFIRELFVTTSHHYIMFFTNKGRVYRLKAYEIPEAGRTARGTAVINLLQLMPDEKITATIPIKEYEDGKYLFMATKKGLVKKTPIQDYMNVRKTGLAAISLREDDLLIEVKVTDNAQDILLVTKYGQCIRFNEKDVRSTGRVSMGVRGMNLSDNDEIIGMQMSSQGKDMLIVSEKGMGKRTSMEEFTKQNRGGKGVKCYKITEKTGNVVGMKAVDEESEIMINNTEGIVIRMKCSDISQYGRITSGVKLINLPEKEKVASVAKVRTASAEIDGEEVEIKEEDDSPENTSEIIVDNSEDNVSDDVENK